MIIKWCKLRVPDIEIAHVSSAIIYQSFSVYICSNVNPSFVKIPTLANEREINAEVTPIRVLLRQCLLLVDWKPYYKTYTHLNVHQ